MARCVIVLGVGCSGTSAVAGVLHHLGCPMGLAGHLVMRPEGVSYFEDKCFYGQFHEASDNAFYRARFRLLWKRHRIEPIWGWKNTLTAKAMPWLLDVIEDLGDRPYCVAVHRSFYSSVRGRAQGKCPQGELHTRQQAEVWGVEAMHDYWDALYAIQARGSRLHHVSFEDLIKRPGEEVERLAQFAFTGLEGPTYDQVRAAVEHVDPSLVRN